MIEIRNIIIKELQKYINQPVIPNTDVENRPQYPFIDYSITALIGDNSEGNNIYTEDGEKLSHILELQPKISFSFNAYSKDETEGYNTVKDIWNFFKHIGIENLKSKGIAVVDLYDIHNRTVLEVDKFEVRYGFDVIVRYKDLINRYDDVMDNYNIKGEGVR